MAKVCYQKLAEHLDRLPGGFATSDTGADLRLLCRLFTPDEAELATFLTLEPEPPQVIADRIHLPVTQVAYRLNEMAEKGLLFLVKSSENTILYQAAPWVIGIYEF